MAALRAPRCAAPLTARARGGQTRQSQPRRAPARCAGLGARLLGSAAALNAERLARKEAAELVGAKTGGVKPLLVCPLSKSHEKPAPLAELMRSQGCVGVRSALSDGTAKEVLAYINALSDQAKAEVTEGRVDFGARFGGVNCRGRGVFGARQDLWLPVEAVPVAKALREVASEERLGPLLRELVGPGALLHEVSCLVSDPGAPRQCVHADTIVLPSPQFPNASMEPLYTFFVALQDVEDDMGHTVFLPRTHTPRAHEIWNGPQRQKEMFISVNDATQSNLDLGDVAIFDSRLLHCGRENSSDKRRVLFYFTVSAQHDWPLPNGKHGSNSIRAEDRGKWTLRDFGLDEAVAEGDPASKSRRDVLAGVAAAMLGGARELAEPRAASAAAAPTAAAQLSVLELEAAKANIVDALVERQYYLTGDLPKELVAPGAHFIDPTTDVVGWEKYTSAVASLFDPAASKFDLLDAYVVPEQNAVFAEWRLEGEIRLPWGRARIQPYLGTTLYSIDEQGRIARQFEEWNISGAEAFLSCLPGWDRLGIGTPPAPPAEDILAARA